MAVWGGGGANTWREAFIKQFSPGNGSTIKMVEVPNPAGALRSPAAAGQYSLALVTYFEAIALSNAGLIESFDDKQLPGIADVDPKYLTRDKAGRHVGLPVYFTYYGIAYNTDLAKAEDFASWQGLADPKWKGKLSLTRPVYLAPYDAVIMAKAMGGSEKDIGPGFAALKKIAPGVVEWPTTFARMGQFLQDETAAMGFYSAASAAEMEKRGIPVKHVVAKPLLFTGTAIGIMKNAPNPEGARVFLNWWISKEVQAYRAERYGNVVMNTEVTTNKFPVAALAEMQRIDYALVNAKRAEWIATFEREVLPLK